MRRSLCIVVLGGWDAWAAGDGTGRLLPHGETCGLLGMCQAFSYSWGGFPEFPALCGREKKLECSLGPFSPTLQNLNEKTDDQRGNIFPTTGIAPLHPCWAELTLPDSNPHCRLLHLFSALSTSVNGCFDTSLEDLLWRWTEIHAQFKILCFTGLGRSLEEVTATHSNFLAWRIPWTEEPGGLQFIRSHRVRHNWSDLAHTYTLHIWQLQRVNLKNSHHKKIKFGDYVMMDSN